MENIEIPKRASKCVKDGRKFSPGSEYISFLEREKDGSFKRFDYCLRCRHEGGDERNLIFWRSQIPLREKRGSGDNSLTAKAVSFLRDYRKSAKEEVKAQAFLLAQLLVRSRQVKLRKDIGNELIYEVLADGSILRVEKVDIDHLTREDVEKMNLING